MSNFIHSTIAVTKVIFARLRFLAVFIVAGLIVGYWDNIKNHVDKWTRPDVAPDVLAAHSDVEYYCVMHPNIIRSEPGNCPICGMPLAKRKKGELTVLPADVLARVQLTPRRIALANIQTTEVEPRVLVREIDAAGVLDYDETRVAQISSRVAGRADELFVKFTGQSVKKGEPLYSLYSPEVYTAQREYLEARRRVNELKGGPADARNDAAAVYNASQQKLVLWGMEPEQLDRLDQEYDRTGKVPTHFQVTSPISGIVIRKNIYEGAYLQAGDTPYTIADLSTLWMQARLYEEDVPLVKIGDQAEVAVDAMPNETFAGRVTFLAYELDPTSRTLAARIEVPNPKLSLRPGMFAEATLRLPVMADGHDHPSTQPSTKPAGDSMIRARVFAEAVKPYLAAQKILVSDTDKDVSKLLHEAVAKLEPIAKDPAIAPDYQRLVEAVHKTMGQEIEPLRETFKDVSLAMIAIGKTAGLPTDAPAIQEFRCPMKKGNWLQEIGETRNPYDPKGMLTCGSAVANIPRASASHVPATRPARTGKEVLAVPRSAVINTGKDMIVFVENAEIEGAFDMRRVKLGPAAGDYYPVLDGLSEGEKVVTVGAFLLDAENRLNPPVTQPSGSSEAPGSAAPAAHQY